MVTDAIARMNMKGKDSKLVKLHKPIYGHHAPLAREENSDVVSEYAQVSMLTMFEYLLCSVRSNRLQEGYKLIIVIQESHSKCISNPINFYSCFLKFRHFINYEHEWK